MSDQSPIRLPPGVTGYGAKTRIASAEIQQELLQPLRASGVSLVQHVSMDKHVGTFDYARLRLYDDPKSPVSISLLAHKIYRFCACTDAEWPALPVWGLGDSIHFIDNEALARRIRELTAWTVLGTEFLDQQLTPEVCRDLHKGDRYGIKYWESQKIGDVIFNGWD